MADEASFDAAVERIRASGVKCFDVESHAADSPFVKAFQFIDPDDNQIELCVRRQPLAAKDGISHVIFETANLARAKRSTPKAWDSNWSAKCAAKRSSNFKTAR